MDSRKVARRLDCAIRSPDLHAIDTILQYLYIVAEVLSDLQESTIIIIQALCCRLSCVFSRRAEPHDGAYVAVRSNIDDSDLVRTQFSQPFLRACKTLGVEVPDVVHIHCPLAPVEQGWE